MKKPKARRHTTTPKKPARHARETKKTRSISEAPRPTPQPIRGALMSLQPLPLLPEESTADLFADIDNPKKRAYLAALTHG